MVKHENAPSGARKRRGGRSMEQLEEDLARILGQAEVAETAVRTLRERYWGSQPFISESDSSGFMVRFALCVAIAAAEHGHGAEESLAMGRDAAAGIKRHYKGEQLYITEVDPREDRDKLIRAVYSDKTALLLQRVTGLAHRNLLQVVRNGTTDPRRALGAVRRKGE